MLGRRREAEPERVEVVPSRVEVRNPMQDPVSTILSSDTHFKGSLSFEKNLKIEGSFEGDITTTGTLHIGKEAKVKAEIKAGSVYVDGSVTGNIIAHDKIELRGTARLEGDIRAAKLVVEEGAVVAGRCEVSFKSAEKELSPSKGLGDLLAKTPVEVSYGSK